ncbi:MAG TPA: hypothetical protein VJK27_01195 [Terriglobales bacterium]|jgi:hypothetical protein|nr:hypothetical protein [Terriglobales bacterium]
MNRQVCAGILGLTFLPAVFLTSCNSSNFNPPTESIAATSGSPQNAQLNQTFTSPLVATVTMGSTPVSGAFVTFTAPATGASGIFSNGTNTETDTTNSSGVVTSSPFTANGIIGADTVVASVAGVTASVNFLLTNTSGPAASIAATSGSLQVALINTAFGAPLVATVFDSNSNPVTGAAVTFTAPATGASGVFSSNSTTTETDTTNASGVATSSTFKANATTGGFTVTATVSGVATPANFILTNTTSPLISISATSGTPQSATVNSTFAAPLVATVMNGSQPVANQLVTFEVPATGPSGTFAGGVNSATTNSNGVATSVPFTANGSIGSYTVTATVPLGAEPATFGLTNTSITYAFYLNGLEALDENRDVPNFYALAGSVTVDGNGNVLGGEQDYNDGLGLTSPQPSGDTIAAAAKALVVDPTTGQGTLTLTTDNPNVGNNGVETLGVQFVNLNHALVVQFDGSATSSGSMDTQTLSSTLNDGNYAFTLTGVDPYYYSVVFGGVFSISSSGTALSGTFDEDDFGGDTTPTLGTTFSGTITGPDAYGRGTITGLSNPATASTVALNYYVVGPEAIRIIDVDNYNSNATADSAVGSAFGQGTGTFSAASLSTSVFGIESNSLGSYFAALGQFSTTPGSSTFSGVADDNEFENGVIANAAAIAGTYSIANNGYGSFTITPGDLGDISVFGLYMTDPNLNLNDPNNTTSGLGGALVADLDGFDLNGVGVVTPQTDTATADFAGNYAFGGQAYNDFDGDLFGWEFDFVAQGGVKNNALSKVSGLVSDPFFALGGNPSGSDVKFQGVATPDGSNPGRYTIRVGITVPTETPVYVESVIYQASGGQLYWLDEDPDGESVFLGPISQQGTLAGIPALKTAGGARAAKHVGDRQ